MKHLYEAMTRPEVYGAYLPDIHINAAYMLVVLNVVLNIFQHIPALFTFFAVIPRRLPPAPTAGETAGRHNPDHFP